VRKPIIRLSHHGFFVLVLMLVAIKRYVQFGVIGI